MDTKVIVVGAGIAGLTAAYFLNRQGVPAKVIEAGDRVGGRMTSDMVNGYIVDRGAQFLSTEYSIILYLLQKLNLSQQICTTSQCSAIIREGVPQSMCVNRPLDMLKLFDMRVLLKFMWKTLALNRKQKKLSLSDYSQWTAFDTENTACWLNRDIDREVTRYLYEPMLQGFYFQTPEETSKALAAVLTAFSMRRAQTLSLDKGLGLLPETLARCLDVMLNTTVQAVESVGGMVCVQTPSETFLAEHVILAVPAPVGKNLIAQPEDSLMAALLDTPYSASINVACITDGDFKLPEGLVNVYGLLIPRNERTAVAAVGIENNKNRRSGGGHLLNIMFSHEAAIQFMHSPDDHVAASAIRSVVDYFPSLPAHIANSRVYRWPAAEPLSPVGRSTQLHEYRKRCEKDLPRIILTGDYMSMPYTEGAAESGYWAASMIVRAFNGSFQRVGYGNL